MTSLIDAYDTVVFSDLVLSRLREAGKTLNKKQQLVDEKQWLGIATDRLAAACTGALDLATRSIRLPELASVRSDQAKLLQNGVIDAVERLQAGITFHGGPRAPVLEELFGKLKLPALRRAPREDFEKFITTFSKRLKTQYVKRIFADPDFAFAMPAVDQLSNAFESWRSTFAPEPLPEAEEAALREQLLQTAAALEMPLRQAKLLAEAALLPLGELFAESGIGAKPKKRAVAVEEAPAEAPAVEAAVAEPAVQPAPETEAAPDAAPVKKAKRVPAPRTNARN